MSANAVRAILLALLLGATPAAPLGRAAEPPPATCPPAARAPSPEEIRAGLESRRDRGPLWRLAKSGRTSYLYGTIHVGKLEWAMLGPSVTDALRESDVAAVEIDLTNPAVVASLGALAAAGSNPPKLPPTLRERLDRQIRAACVPAAAVASLHPVMQAISLTSLAGRWDGLDPSFAIDLAISGLARGLEKPVVSLESVELQMKALIPEDADEAIELIDGTLEQLEKNKVRPLLARLAGAWERGDLEEIASYERWCDCANSDEEREFLERLNDGRNPHLAAGIDAIHLDGRRVFAAVGALHMVGRRALPKLLAERGYTVERVSGAAAKPVP